MCTLIVLHRCFPEAPLLAAANRDEYHARPAAGPALRRWNGRLLLAPLDEQAGGTWLGVNGAGLFAALTNRPEPEPDPARRSRGLLVSDALAGHDRASDAAETLRALPAASYNPFNLLLADAQQAFVASYRERVSVIALAPGAHVVTNALPDDRAHPKCGRLLTAAEKTAAGPQSEALPALTKLCRSHEGGEQNPLDGACIHTAGYGTRSSTLLSLSRQPAASRFLSAEGAPCENDFEDLSPQLRALLEKTETGDDPEVSERSMH